MTYLILLLLSFNTIASDIISQRNEFLWKLDTSQIQTSKGFVFGNKDDFFKEQLLKTHLRENMSHLYKEEYFNAASYSDNINTYIVSLDMKNSESCILSIHPNKVHTEIIQMPVQHNYCESLLGINYTFGWKNVKFLYPRLITEVYFYYLGNHYKK
jgi:hypothetical protein